MSRIRMKVFIHNDSDRKLLFAGGEVKHGSYTPDWNPPPVIEPGATKGFQGEGNLVVVPTTGTEGRVRYTIEGEPGEIYIHWNSPLVESQYANTFHIWAPPNWDVSHSGGQGGNAKLDIRVRRTERRSVPNFHPKTNGFSFPNAWKQKLPVMSVGYLWNRLFESLPGPLGSLGIKKVVDENWLPLTDTSMGICGGMVYSVMDYYHHNMLPPNQRASYLKLDDALFLFIRQRLWDSFDVTGNGHRFLAYSSPHYPNGDEGPIQNIAALAKGRSWIAYREEWPRIQRDIDAGKLAPVGLIQTDSLDIGSNHQVLAYAYEKSGQSVTLFIYDPNFPQDEVGLVFDVTSTTGEVHVKRLINGQPSAQAKRIFGFFKIDGYQPKKPPIGRNAPYGTNSGSITSVSRIPNSMETWWVEKNGSVQGAYWYEGDKWKRYELAPAGSAAPNGSITAVSRVPHSMEVFWVGKDGSVQGAYWYEGNKWKRYELAPAKSAAPKAGIAVLSRLPHTMEVWWIGENGSVQDAYWYEGDKWKRYELAPAGSASLSAGIAAVSRVPNSMEIWWIGAKGGVTGAYWYEGDKGFRRYELSTAVAASVTGSITALSRIPTSMEIWWLDNDGSVQAAYWYEGGKWERYQLAPPGSADSNGNLASISRDPKKMQVFWTGRDGLINCRAGAENGTFAWRSDSLNATRKAAPDGGMAVVSRILNSQELFWIEKDRSVEGAYRYYDAVSAAPWGYYELAAAPPAIDKDKLIDKVDKIVVRDGGIPSFRKKK